MNLRPRVLCLQKSDQGGRNLGARASHQPLGPDESQPRRAYRPGCGRKGRAGWAFDGRSRVTSDYSDARTSRGWPCRTVAVAQADSGVGVDEDDGGAVASIETSFVEPTSAPCEMPADRAVALRHAERRDQASDRHLPNAREQWMVSRGDRETGAIKQLQLPGRVPEGKVAGVQHLPGTKALDVHRVEAAGTERLSGVDLDDQASPWERKEGVAPRCPPLAQRRDVCHSSRLGGLPLRHRYIATS